MEGGGFSYAKERRGEIKRRKERGKEGKGR